MINSNKLAFENEYKPESQEEQKVDKVRLLVCIGEFVPGAGQSRVVWSELDTLSGKYDIKLVAPRLTAVAPAGVSIERISTMSPRGVLRLRSLVRSADIVHLHDSLGFMAIAISADSKKCIVTSHGIAPPSIRHGVWQKVKGHVTLLTYPWLYRRALKVVTMSDFLLEWLQKRRVDNCTLVSWGAPEEIVTSVRPPSGMRLVYVGEVSHRKGLDLLVEGIAACPPDVTLDVVGSGDGEWLADLVARFGVGDRVINHGRLLDSPMMTLLDTALAVVSFSRWEGFGLPIVEGFSRGRPAIVLSGSAMAEVVDRAVAGLIVDDPRALPKAVQQVADRWSELSEAAISAAKRMRWTDTWASYDRIFEDILVSDRPESRIVDHSGRSDES